jgi:hypothetical protein
MAGFGIPKDRLLVPVLGIFQIFAWGSSFYLLAVLAKPIASDTGWPSLWIVGSLSGGLLVAGIASPRVGALIGRYGGRPVLAAASVLLAHRPRAHWLSVQFGDVRCGVAAHRDRNGGRPLRSGICDAWAYSWRQGPAGYHHIDPLGRVRQHDLLAPIGAVRRSFRLARRLFRLCADSSGYQSSDPAHCAARSNPVWRDSSAIHGVCSAHTT